MFDGCTVAGADGEQTLGDISGGDCCVPSICALDPCDLRCSFVNLLPSGPLWDDAKRHYTENELKNSFPNNVTVCQTLNSCDPCTSLVQYAAYKGQCLYDICNEALFPVIRESKQETAFTTMDDWLHRLRWQNCFQKDCIGDCATAKAITSTVGFDQGGYAFVGASTELNNAVKHGILLALKRAQMSPIKNVASLNWIIEPLGASLNYLGCWKDLCCDNCIPCRQHYQVCGTGAGIPCWTPDQCNRPSGVEPVACLDQYKKTSYWLFGTLCPTKVTCHTTNNINPNFTTSTGLSINPGVISAYCLLKSLIPNCGGEIDIQICQSALPTNGPI